MLPLDLCTLAPLSTYINHIIHKVSLAAAKSVLNKHEAAPQWTRTSGRRCGGSAFGANVSVRKDNASFLKDLRQWRIDYMYQSSNIEKNGVDNDGRRDNLHKGGMNDDLQNYTRHG